MIPKRVSTASRGISFSRTFFTEGWTFSSASTVGFWRRYTPLFSELPNVAEYVALFDEYKVTGIKMTFHPRNVGVFAQQSQTTALQNQFYITYAIDTEHSGLVPSGFYNAANYNKFLEESGPRAKTRLLNKPVSFFYRPKIRDDVGGGFNLKACPWMQTNVDDTLLYGAQIWLHDYNFGALNPAAFGVDVQYTFYFKCRGYN